MNVIFVEPCFPRNQREFPRALAEVGATVVGIGERPKEYLDDEMRRWLSHYEQVPSVVNEDALLKTVRWVQNMLPVDRIEATVEAHILPVARVREACGIPGTSYRTAFLCRDKPAMKEALREAGIPCAQSIGTHSWDEAWEFARRVGYPLVVKPRAAAGASGTYRVEDDGDLAQVLRDEGVDQGREVAIEEFIEGHEGFFDTITIDGQVTHEFISHYYPNVLEAMRTRWISPQFIATNRVDSAPSYDEVKDMGRRVIAALGIETSATHMEWFFGSKGLKFSEIGCRPPGVGAWDLYCAGNEFDLYGEWAMAIVHGRPAQKPTRRYAAGIINLRPDQDGHITHYEGLDAINSTFGDCIIDYHLPSEGAATQGVEAGYMANAWVRMKHPDYDELRRILNIVGNTVKVHAA